MKMKVANVNIGRSFLPFDYVIKQKDGEKEMEKGERQEKQKRVDRQDKWTRGDCMDSAWNLPAVCYIFNQSTVPGVTMWSFPANF